MNKHLLISLLCLFIANLTFGQDWKIMQQKGKSFKEINAIMTSRFQGKSTKRDNTNYSKEFKQYARWEHYWRQNLDASGNFVTAKQVLASWEEAQGNDQAFQSLTGTSNWSYIGPDTIPTATEIAYAGMGRLNTIAFNPSNTNVFWVGTANGGVWKTTDGGANWEAKGDNLPVIGISDIALSYTGDTIYIASGDADGMHSVSIGVLKSTDGGNTFLPTGFTNTVNNDESAMFQIHHLWIHPNDANLVVATTTTGIHRTTNGGTTWMNVDEYPASDLKMDPNNPNQLYVGSMDAIIESTDAGATWSDVLHIINGAEKIDLAVSAANSNVIYAISDNAQGAKSVDGGQNWTTLNLPDYNTQGGYDMAIVVAPNDANKILLGGVQGWVSTNGGASWTLNLNGVFTQQGDEGKYLHSDHHMMKYMPGSNDIIFSAHDGGLHKGNFFDINATWTDLSHGLFITQFYGMDGFPGDANILIAGAQDNDAVFYNSTTWKNINNNSDGTGGVIDYTNSNISYAKSQSGGVNRTTDAWVNDDMNISVQTSNQADQAGFVWPMVIHPTVPTTLYAGYGNIYRTTDKGDNWTNITNESDVTQPYSSISVAPSNPNTIYAIRNETEIKVSTNAGTSWTTVTSPTNGMITRIQASLTDATKVYITVAGYIAGEKVFVSTNTGASWTNISNGIPNIPAQCIVEKQTSGELYVGTALGVYTKTGTGTIWTSFNTNLPNVTVSDLNIHEATNMLRAATFGRGIWKTPLSADDCPSTLEITANPASGAFNAAQTITTSGTVEVTGTASFVAGTSITLNNGFHAKAGSVFSATISACTPSSLSEAEVANLVQWESNKDLLEIQQPLKNIEDMQIAPNPFSGITNVTFNLKKTMPISVQVYNSNGQLIDNLASEHLLQAGKHQFLFNGIYQPEGMYFIRLRTPEEQITKKIVLLK